MSIVTRTPRRTDVADHDFVVAAWGPQALFAQPHFRADPYTSLVPSPSALMGLLRSIYWKPEMELEIAGIGVCNPIRLDTTKVRSVKVSVARASSGNPSDRTLTTITHLVDVKYLIFARVIENPLRPRAGSHLAELYDRVRARERGGRGGQQFRPTYFGRREYPAEWELLEGALPPVLSESRPLGTTLLNLFPVDLGNVASGRVTTPDRFEAVFFRAHLTDGIVHVPREPWVERRARTFAIRNRAHAYKGVDGVS